MTPKAAQYLDSKIVDPEIPGHIDFEREKIVAYNRVKPFMTDKGIPVNERQPFRDYF